MKTLLFLDDERNFDDVTCIDYPKFDRVVAVLEYSQFKKFLDNYLVENGTLNGLSFSFDHDLGLLDSEYHREFSGYDCAYYLIESIVYHQHIDPNKISYFVHSMNPVGKKNIEELLECYKEFYNKHNK